MTACARWGEGGALRTRASRRLLGPAGARRPRRDSISYRAGEVWQTPHKQGSSPAGMFQALGESSGVTRRFRLP